MYRSYQYIYKDSTNVLKVQNGHIEIDDMNVLKGTFLTLFLCPDIP